MNDRSFATRREFLHVAGAACAGGLVASPLAAAAPSAAASSSSRIKKAVKIGMVNVKGTLLEKMQLLKELGYDGVELMAPGSEPADEVLAAQEKSGLPVHGVVDSAHWKQTLSDPDPGIRAIGVRALEQAIRDSKAYGGTSVLLVPAVVNKQVSYADAYERSQAEIRRVLPLAEELQIRVLFENVWNNFLLSPLEMARYIDEFESKWVGAYFDVGNVVHYGWPEQWIRTLGARIGKLDIKEYSRAKCDQEGPRAGFGVELGEGDCDWPAVMAALADIGYQGWGTAEVRGGDRERLADIAKRMDRCFAA